MKNTLIALVILLLLPVMASADWNLAIKADDGDWSYAAPYTHLGAASTASDGQDSGLGALDLETQYFPDKNSGMIWSVGYIPGVSKTWTRDYMSSASPSSYQNGIKAWELRVAAGPNCPDYPDKDEKIRLLFHTLGSSSLPPSTIGDSQVKYRLVMKDNKGIAGAPANGKTWEFGAPTSHSAAPFYEVPDLLPMLRLSALSHTAMIDEGYVLEFQQVVPEPGSLVSLALGMSIVSGWALRRRRS